jgi:hypothetical protein
LPKAARFNTVEKSFRADTVVMDAIAKAPVSNVHLSSLVVKRSCGQKEKARPAEERRIAAILIHWRRFRYLECRADLRTMNVPPPVVFGHFTSPGTQATDKSKIQKGLKSITAL